VTTLNSGSFYANSGAARTGFPNSVRVSIWRGYSTIGGIIGANFVDGVFSIVVYC